VSKLRVSDAHDESTRLDLERSGQMAEPVVTSMLRYDEARNVFEYRAGETAPVMEFEAASIAALCQSIKMTGSEAMLAVFEFLVANAKQRPGRWVEASSRPSDRIV
jgi:hypothetical protein